MRCQSVHGPARQLMALEVALTGQALAQSSGRQHECALQWAGGRAE
jgi:hypothetical protein